jgi:putative PIN family toxin of toxin-antitoxin system
MKNEVRVVFDTGVIVSAVLLPRFVPRQAFDLSAARGRFLVSEATIVELGKVLRRPKFDKYVEIKKRLEFLATFCRETEIVAITEPIIECRDPNDER